MANWSDLKAAVAEVIKTNGNQEITGQILQNTLNSIVSNLGENATFVGIATPTTNPGTPDGPVFYFAFQPGTYSNFNANVISEKDNTRIFYWNGTDWLNKDTGIPNSNRLYALISSKSNQFEISPDTGITDNDIFYAESVKYIRLITKEKENIKRYFLWQQGYSVKTNKVVFYFVSPNNPNIDSPELIADLEYNFDVDGKPSGLQYYEAEKKGVLLQVLFDWDEFNSHFDNLYLGSVSRIYLITPIYVPQDFIISGNSETEQLKGDVNLLEITSRGFLSTSSTVDKYIKGAKCFEYIKIENRNNASQNFYVYQFGVNSAQTVFAFYFGAKPHYSDSDNTVLEFVKEQGQNVERKTGIEHIDLLTSDGYYRLIADWNWDKFNEYFPADMCRPNLDTDKLKIQVQPVLVEETKQLEPNFNLGSKIMVKHGGKILLVGASFASSLNGWFELACSKLGITGVNQAIGGQNIFNNVAERMLDADETMPHGSLFYVDGEDIFEEVEAIVIMMTHDFDVYLSDDSFTSNTLTYYNEHGVGNTDRALAFDYVLKQYKQWCAEYTVNQQRESSGQQINDVIGSKKCQILICSNWNSGRKAYNDSSKKLANRFGCSYCDFTANDNLGGNFLIETTTNTDSNNTAISIICHPSVLYAHYDSYYNGNWAGKTEIKDGIIYGWHPQLRSTTFNYGNSQESDGYYYPDIQYMLSKIFQDCIEIY